jgi:hypothetical protein
LKAAANAPSNLVATAPAPRYAVIDLGTNMIYPMKMTSSGHVLGEGNYNSTNNT